MKIGKTLGNNAAHRADMAYIHVIQSVELKYVGDMDEKSMVDVVFEGIFIQYSSILAWYSLFQSRREGEHSENAVIKRRVMSTGMKKRWQWTTFPYISANIWGLKLIFGLKIKVTKTFKTRPKAMGSG